MIPEPRSNVRVAQRLFVIPALYANLCSECDGVGFHVPVLTHCPGCNPAPKENSRMRSLADLSDDELRHELRLSRRGIAVVNSLIIAGLIVCFFVGALVRVWWT